MLHRIALIACVLWTAQANPRPSIAADSRELVYSDSMASEVKVSSLIVHGLSIQSMVDRERHYLTLQGPELFSNPLTVGKSTDPISYLTWYKVRKPGWKSDQEVTVAVGDQKKTYRLGAPQFFLMPVQILTQGPPSPVPDLLNHFLVFETVEPESDQSVFVAVPAEEWHHDENFPIKSKDSWLVISKQTDDDKLVDSMSTLDQFGLNQLTPGQPKYRVQLATPVKGNGQ